MHYVQQGGRSKYYSIKLKNKKAKKKYRAARKLIMK